MKMRVEVLLLGMLLLGEVALAAPSGADTLAVEAPRRGVVRRVIDYFGNSTEDRTAEKALDITFAGGPSYSKTTGLGLGLLGSGLYRLDRTDTLTAPSDLSLYANIATTGFFSVGINGNTLFAANRRRLIYELSFTSAPRDFWGFGYQAGRHNPSEEILEERYALNAHFQQRVVEHTYLGLLLDVNYTNGRRFGEQALAYLGSQHRHYLATGVGLTLEYDSRDFIPNPSRGIYLSLQETLYPRALGNAAKSYHRTKLTADLYQQLWRGGLMAFDLYGEFNSDGTPWTMLARMGGNNRMRGYYEGQYMDRNLVTCQVELRQHLWRRFGGVVWGGAGNLFPRMSSFRWSETLPNYGLGLRWELKKRVNVRMDYGFGRSTSGFLLSINEAF